MVKTTDLGPEKYAPLARLKLDRWLSQKVLAKNGALAT